MTTELDPREIANEALRLEAAHVEATEEATTMNFDPGASYRLKWARDAMHGHCLTASPVLARALIAAQDEIATLRQQLSACTCSSTVKSSMELAETFTGTSEPLTILRDLIAWVDGARNYIVTADGATWNGIMQRARNLFAPPGTRRASTPRGLASHGSDVECGNPDCTSHNDKERP